MASSPSPSATLLGSTRQTLIVVSSAFFSLSIVCVCLRFYIRKFTKTGLGWDDWLILAALIFGLVSTGLLLWANTIDPNGPAEIDSADQSYVYSQQDQLFLQLTFISSVIYFTTASATRLGTLFTYNRIFSVRNAFRYQVAVLGGLVAAYWVTCTAASLTSCIPLQHIWTDGRVDPQYCFNFDTFWMMSGAAEVVLDVLILGLPVHAVLSLQVSMERRLAFLMIFIPSLLYVIMLRYTWPAANLNVSAVATGILRTCLSFSYTHRTPIFSRSEIWTTIHTGTAIICACLPIFKPLLVKIAEAKFVTQESNATSRLPILPTAERWEPLRSNPTAVGDRAQWTRAKHIANDSTSSNGSDTMALMATPMSEAFKSPGMTPKVDTVRSPTLKPIKETSNGPALTPMAETFKPVSTPRNFETSRRDAPMNRDPRFWTAIGLGIRPNGSASSTERKAAIATLKESPGREARWSKVSHNQSDSGSLQTATVSDFTYGAYEDENVERSSLLSPELAGGSRPALQRKTSEWELDPAVYTLLQLRRPSVGPADDPNIESREPVAR